MKKRLLKNVFLVSIICLSICSIGVKADSSGAKEVILHGGKNLDIVFKVGKTKVDYSNISDDLFAALKDKGALVNSDGVKIEEGTTLTTNAFDWWSYDHTNETVVIDDEKHNYIESQTVAGTQNTGNYELARHISIEDDGATFAFKGYGTSAYKDFLYLPNSSSEKKTFTFEIEEKEAHDALDGTGFLFNTSITGSYTDGSQLMSGYFLMLEYNTSGVGSAIKLYKFKDINTKTFHNTASGLISGTSGFTLVAKAPYSSTDKFRRFQLITTKDSVKLYYKGHASSFDTIKGEFVEGDLVTFTDAADSTKTATSYQLVDMVSNSYGFGTLISYRSHGCDLKTNIQFTNVSMVDEKNVSLLEGDSKREDTDNFLIYLTDNTISDLKNEESINKLNDKLNLDNAYYIGWGTKSNDEESLNFINKYRSGKASFIYSDDGSTYSKQLEELVNIIISNSEQPIANTTSINIGDEIEFKPHNVELTGTDAAWQVIYRDADGRSETSALDDLSIDTNIAGTYEIYYNDVLLNTLTINEVVTDVPKTGVFSIISIVISSLIIISACGFGYYKFKLAKNKE